jgi:hypothetical protein
VIEGLKKAAEELARYAPMKVNGRCQMYFDGAIHLLKDQEELVRCKDCKYAKSLNDQYLGCSCLVDGIDSDYVMTVKPESYCSWGEKAVKQCAESAADGGGQEGGAGPEG